jgi:vacuolar protein sorting-associated protein 13B
MILPPTLPFSQVQLIYELADTMSKVWSKIQKRGNLSPSSVYPETVAGPIPGSPVWSSVGTAPPDTSTCSPSADIGTTTEVSGSEDLCYPVRDITQ